MNLLPDILLPASGPRTGVPGVSERQRQATQDDSASFANVYAKQREAAPAARQSTPERPAARNDGQARAADSGKAPAHARRDERVGEQADQASEEPTDEAAPMQAEAGNGGNALPPEAADELPLEGDQALELLGLSLGDAPEADAGDEEESLPELESAVLPVPAQPAQDPLTSPAAEIVLAAPVAVPVVTDSSTPSLSGDADAPAEEQPLVSSHHASPANGERAGAVLSSLAAASGQTSADGEGAGSNEGAFEQAAGELLEGAAPGQEARTELKESFAHRLNGLTQAIAQQSGASPRNGLALVPGQPVAMQRAGMSEAVVDRVMWMSSQNLKSAEIQLDPAELGRMEVRIELVKDQAQVSFISPHAGVRDALEGQMQRLRDMFAQQGMNLLDVNVSDQSLARGGQGQGGESSGRGVAGIDSTDDETLIGGVAEIAANRPGSQRGLVDYYA